MRTFRAQRPSDGPRASTERRNKIVMVYVLLPTLVVLVAVLIWFMYEALDAAFGTDPSPKTVKRLVKRSGVDYKDLDDGSTLLNNNFKGYRVGDAYKHAKWPVCFQYWTSLPQWHRKRFPGTIAADITREGRWMRDHAVMDKIISRHAPKHAAKFKEQLESEAFLVDNIGKGGLTLKECFDTSKGVIARTTPHTALVHIRIGDVLVDGFRMSMTGVEADQYKRVASRLRSIGIDKAVLIGGVHVTPKGTDVSASVAYAREVATYLEEEGIRSVMMSSDPDLDLCLLVEAEVLVAHPKSGFSRIAIDVRKRRALEWQTTIRSDK